MHGLSSAAIPSTLSKNKYCVLKLIIDSIPLESYSYWLYPLQVFCPYRRRVLLLSRPKLWVVSLPWILLLLSTLKTSITSILFEVMLLLFLPRLHPTSYLNQCKKLCLPKTSAYSIPSETKHWFGPNESQLLLHLYMKEWCFSPSRN